MKIEDLTFGNLSEMTELFIDIFSKEPWCEIWDREMAYERLEIFLNHPKMIALGAFEENRLCGFALGNVQPYKKEYYFYLEEICVDTQLQGKGVGSLLWNSLERKCKNRNITSISFLTMKHTMAEEFYKKQQCEIEECVTFMKKDLIDGLS